jgi:hypothetical protein
VAARHGGKTDSSGMTPAFESLFALTMIMNLIFVFPIGYGLIVSLPHSRSAKAEIDNHAKKVWRPW